MSYNNKYILAFDNELNENYEIHFDYKDYTGNSVRLFGAEDCLTIRSTAGDENKMEPILGREALINVVVGPVEEDGIRWDNSDLVIDDLIAEHDSDIMVTVYKDKRFDSNVFKGFVAVEDNSQPFLDPPFTLSIRALDGLGLLKGVDFVDANGDLFTRTFSVIRWIGQLLWKTGINLPIKSYFNFSPLGAGALLLDPINFFKINAITFRQGEETVSTDPTVDTKASAADDCYTVLEKLIRNCRCRLFQEDGCWHIVNLYEHANPLGYSYTQWFMVAPNETGEVGVEVTKRVAHKNFDITIGPASQQTIHPVNDDATRSLKQATKWIKLSYTYDQSLNKICNQSLLQGDRNFSYDQSIVDENDSKHTVQRQGYEAFCFDHFDGAGSAGNRHPYPTLSATKRGYIGVVIDALGFEQNRYLVLEKSTNAMTYFRSSQMLIDVSDVIQLSFDWRSKDNIHTGSATAYVTAAIFLYGDDGTHWALRSVSDGALAGNPNIWVKTDANFQTTSGGTPLIASAETFDTANWQNVTVNGNPGNNYANVKAPVSGFIEILFIFQTDGGGTEYWFKNISISIIPLLQGSYTPIKGDYNYSSSKNDIKQTYAEDAQISDSPKRYFKGAILDLDEKTLIPSKWVRTDYPAEKPMRFTQAMERILFNNMTRQLEKIEGTFRGVTYVDADNLSDIRNAGFLNSYFFSMHPVPKKKFILTSYEIDYAKGSGRRVFVEMCKDENDECWLDPTDPAVGNYQFQYVFQ